MNGYQRIQKVLKGEWPDQRPVMLHNFMHAARDAGYTMKEYRDDPEKAARTHIQAVEKFDTDGILIDIDTATLAGAVGVPVDFPENEPARVEGAALQDIKEIEGLVPIDISGNERVQMWLETCRIVKDYFGNEKFIRGNCDQAPFSLAGMMRGLENWMMDLISNAPFTHKLLNYCTEIAIQFIRLMARTGVDMVSNGDSLAGPEMISPDLYREFALPYEKMIIDEAHKLNLPYVLHICGNTDLILEDMIRTRPDALELDYKTDIYKIYDFCHNKLTFIGNIDPTGILARGRTPDVEEKVKELLIVYKESPRLIVNAGCAIPRDTPSENIKKLIETTRTALPAERSER